MVCPLENHPPEVRAASDHMAEQREVGIDAAGLDHDPEGFRVYCGSVGSGMSVLLERIIDGLTDEVSYRVRTAVRVLWKGHV